MGKAFDFIYDHPGFVAAKNIHSQILALSKSCATSVGFADIDTALGKTDYEIPCKVSEIAEQFIRTDKEVIKREQKIVSLDVVQYVNGSHVILEEKMPIKNDSDVIEWIFCTGIELNHSAQASSYFSLYLKDRKLLGDSFEQKTYILGFPPVSVSLTPRQETCLFLLMRGKTNKEIAKILNLSPRTIEEHINNLKVIMQCDSKLALIEKAIDGGYLHYLPTHISPDAISS